MGLLFDVLGWKKRNGQWLFFIGLIMKKKKHRDLREDMWLLLLLIENKGDI
jgi:hypothetical protein